MNPHQKSELVVACRQYTTAKAKICKFFPSLQTIAEIDALVSTLIDMASIPSSSVSVSEPKARPAYSTIIGAIHSHLAQAPNPVSINELLTVAKTVKQTTTRTYIYNLCATRPDVLHRVRPGWYVLYQADSSATPKRTTPKRTASKRKRVVDRCGQVMAILTANENVPMNAAQIVEAIKARGWPIVGTKKTPFSKHISNILMRRTDIFDRRGKGHYALKSA